MSILHAKKNLNLKGNSSSNPKSQFCYLVLTQTLHHLKKIKVQMIRDGQRL